MSANMRLIKTFHTGLDVSRLCGLYVPIASLFLTFSLTVSFHLLQGSVWVLVGASLQCSAQNIAWYARVISRQSLVPLTYLRFPAFTQDALCASYQRHRDRLPQRRRSRLDCRSCNAYVTRYVIVYSSSFASTLIRIHLAALRCYNRYGVHTQHFWRRRRVLA